ncbi:hypothetical protein [Rhodoflexus sp.]
MATLVAFSAFFLFTKWLQSYTDQLLGQAIAELIVRETKGEYTVQYEDLQFEVLKNKLQLSQLAILPHPINTATVANRYSLRVKSVALETESLWQIYFTRELNIIGLTFIKPDIEVESFAQSAQKNPTFSRETGNLYLLIKNYLDKFQIKHFALYQASFGFVQHGEASTTNYRFRHINFVLQNLVIDSASVHNRKKIFYADGFDLSIDGQEIMLPDSLHAFTFDKLEISTQKSAITFRNFRLLPRQRLPAHKHAYQMSVPELSLEGVDFARAYNDNSLIIKNLQIIKPDIAIDRAADAASKAGSWQPDRTFLKIMATVFDSVAIGKFYLQQGAFALFQGKSPKLLLPHLDFGLDSFAFALPDTSASASFPKLKNAVLTLRNQRFFIGDSLYNVHLRYLRLTSHPAQLTAAGITLRERQSSTWQQRLKTDSLVAKLHRWESVAEGKRWHFSTLQLERPVVNMRLPAGASNPITELNALNNSILIDLLKISEGELNMTDAQQSVHLKGCHLQIERLSLPAAINLWAAKLPESLIRLRIGESKLQLAKLQLELGVTQLQTRNGLLQASGTAFAFRTDNSGIRAAQGNVKSFSLKNLDIRHLLKGNWQPVFDTLQLVSAELRLTVEQPATDQAPFPLSMRGAILMQQAAVTLKGSNNDFLKLWGINGTMNFGSDELPLLKQEGSGIYGLWKGYRIAGSQPEIDTDKRLLALRQFTLYTVHGDSARLSLRQLSVRGWDTQSLLRHKYLKIDTLQIDQLQGHFVGRVSQQLPTPFDSLYIGQITASSDSLRLELPAAMRLQTRQLYARLSAIHNSPTAISLAAIEAFRAGETNLQLQPVTLAFADAQLSDAALQELQFNELTLQHKDFDGSFKQASLSLPEKNWQKGQAPALGSLSLVNGEVQLHPDSAQQAFSPLAHPRISNLYVTRTQLKSERLAADIHLLHVEQPFQTDEQSFVHLHAGNVRWRLPNNRDLLRVGTVFYEPISRRLMLDSISLRPNMDINEFYIRYPVRRSYDSYAARQVVIHAPQWRRLFAGEGFFAGFASVDRFDCNVFLDTNFPRLGNKRLFPLDQFAKMPFEVRIDTIQLSNSEIHYREKNRYQEVATLNLNQIRGHIYGLHNRAASNESIRLHIKGSPEGIGEIDFDIFFAAGSQTGEHRIEATFDSIPITIFNGLVEPMAGVRIRRGQITNGSMVVRVNHEKATGKMWLYYNNLKFSILSRRTTDQEEVIVRRSTLLSILANTLIRNKNRRMLLYKGREGYIAQVREPDKSIFTFWGRIILNGALSSIGIGQRTQDKWQQQIRERAQR